MPKLSPMKPDPRDYEIRIWHSAEKGDECFVAQAVEWPGIMAHGETREEAARQIQLALEGVGIQMNFVLLKTQLSTVLACPR